MELLAGHGASVTLDSADVRTLAGIARSSSRPRRSTLSSTYFSDLSPAASGEQIVHDLRVAVYAHLQRLFARFLQLRQKGDLVDARDRDVTRSDRCSS